MEKPYDDATDQELLAGMRAGNSDAIEEFLDRYHSVVDLVARRYRVPPDERPHWIGELLHALALWLMRGRGRPGSLDAYVITSARRKAFAGERDRRARARCEYEATCDLDGRTRRGSVERTIPSAVSEATLRTARGPDDDAPPLPVALLRLVSAMEDGLSEEEHSLLSFVAQRTSFTDIARWLGEPRSTVVTRVTRLRRRLLDTAFRFGWWLDRVDQAELLRFFRRTGVFSEAELDALARHDPVGPDGIRDGMRDQRPARPKRVAERDRSREPEER